MMLSNTLIILPRPDAVLMLLRVVQRATITFSTKAMPSFVVSPSVNRFSCELAIVVMKFCGAHSDKWDGRVN